MADPAQRRPAQPGRPVPRPGSPGQSDSGAKPAVAEQPGEHGSSPGPHLPTAVEHNSLKIGQSTTASADMPGSVTPAQVWQLANWAVTPTYTEEEAAARRAEVRTILLGLVDELAPQ